MKDNYKLIGPVYDFLSAFYSAKSIHRCKLSMINTDHIKAGDKILFAGGGHGKDAIEAAKLGAEVTLIDISLTMLEKFRQDINPIDSQLNIRTVHKDILTFEEFESYDMVVANFFLNVFDEATMLEILAHLIKHAKPAAKVVIGDFAFPMGNPFARIIKKTYWYCAALIFWLLAKNAIHKVYNYPQLLENFGLTIADTKYFPIMKMNLYWSIMAIKESK